MQEGSGVPKQASKGQDARCNPGSRLGRLTTIWRSFRQLHSNSISASTSTSTISCFYPTTGRPVHLTRQLDLPSEGSSQPPVTLRYRCAGVHGTRGTVTNKHTDGPVLRFPRILRCNVVCSRLLPPAGCMFSGPAPGPSLDVVSNNLASRATAVISRSAAAAAQAAQASA